MGEVVVLRDPGGWDCFTPKAEVADLLAKGFTVAEKLNREFDKKDGN